MLNLAISHFKVMVRLNRSIPAIMLFGDGDELTEAYVILAEEMMKYVS